MNERDDDLRLLARVAFLRGLPEPALKDLAGRMRRVYLARGQTLVEERQTALGLFVVRRGRVRVFRAGASGREQVLSVEEPGDSVLELPLFDGGNYPADAQAVTDSEVLFLPRDEFLRFLDHHPEVARQVIRALSIRIRRLVYLVDSLSLQTVRQRVACHLLELSERYGRAFVLPDTIEATATQLGSVREVVSRTLGRLQRDGLIEVHGRGIKILDRERLEQAARAP